MKIISCSGIVIDKTSVGESDQLITLFSDSLGKTTLLLKGIRKSRKREQIAVDTLSFSKFILIKKEEYYNVSKFELIEEFGQIKSDLAKISLALYLLKILNLCFLEGEIDRKIYKLIIKTLKFIEESQEYWKQYLCVSYFIFMILYTHGLVNIEKMEFLEKLEYNVGIEKELLLNTLSNKMAENLKKLASLENEEAEKEAFNQIIILEKLLNKELEIGLNIRKYFLG